MVSDQTKYWIKVSLSGIVIIIFLSIIGIFTAIKVASYYEDKNFTTTEWIDNPDKRFELIKDLQDSKRIKGKTKREVVSILGEPNSNTPKNHDDIMVNGLYKNFPDTSNTGVDMVYYIGTKPGLLQAERYFFIWLENDTVSKYIIRGTYN